MRSRSAVSGSRSASRSTRWDSRSAARSRSCCWCWCRSSAAFALLAALPLALAGGLLALVLLRVPLNVSSMLGGILLVGLVVKNGILLVHRAREREAAGADTREALVDAARLRLRPILMTTLCTLFGLIPLALGLGEGAEMHRPLAIAVLGG